VQAPANVNNTESFDANASVADGADDLPF